MLSSVSKLLDKAFVLGFFLPALLALSAAVNVFHCPKSLESFCTIDPTNMVANLTYFGLVVWIFGILLLSLNSVTYRMFEGYLPPASWLSPLREWHKRRFQRLTNERAALRQQGKKKEASLIQYGLLSRYPPSYNDILPTAFGNAVRAFEMYPRDVYGVDIISVWLRLSAVIPKQYQQLIADARAQADFFVNTALLALVFAIAALARAAFLAWSMTSGPLRDQPAVDLRPLLLAAAVAALISYATYFWSISRIVAWGDLMKSAFDCYLPALAKQLGYTLPAVESKRREFWTDFSRLALYRLPLIDGKWPLAAEAPAAPNAPPAPVAAALPREDVRPVASQTETATKTETGTEREPELVPPRLTDPHPPLG